MSRIKKVGARAQLSLDRARERVDEYPLKWSCAFVFFPLVAIYILTATYDAIQSADPVAAAIPAWQYATHANFNLDGFEGMLAWFVEGRDHVVSDRSPGAIFFAVPFYWMFPGGTEEPTMDPAAFAAVISTAAAITLLHGVFRRLVATSTAMIAALLAGLGTATWTVSADGLWPHGLNQLWFAGALVLLGAGAWSASAPLFGLAIFTRPQTAFAAAVVGIYGSRTTRSLKPVTMIGVASLTGVAGLVAYNVSLFGEVHVAAGYFRRADPALPPSGISEYGEAVLGTLVSPDRGLLVLSSFLLVLIPGLLHAWRVAPAWVKGPALSGGVYMLAHLGLNRFSGGDNFYSYRLPIEMLTLGSPLLVLAWREWTSKTSVRRRLFMGLSGCSILIHALGAVYWSPTFDERSPWTNFKVLEAVQSGGATIVPLALSIVIGTALLMSRASRRTHPGAVQE